MIPSVIKTNLRPAALVTALLAHALLAGPMALTAGAADVQASDVTVAGLAQLVSSGDLDAAVNVARQLENQADPATDLTIPLACLARELQQAGKANVAVEFYQRSLEASMLPGAVRITPQHVIVLRLAAATAMVQATKFSEALDTVRPVLTPASGASEQQLTAAVEICMKIGGAALAADGAATASEAYAMALELANDDILPTAMLGDASASAIRKTEPLKAARKLAAFIDQYPQHPDASRAARACAECLKQAGRADDATVMLADLLDRWPDSEAAAEVVRSHAGMNVDDVPSPVRGWLTRKADTNQLESFDTTLTMLGLQIAAEPKEAGQGETETNEVKVWSNLARHLASIDHTGQTTSDLLARLERNAGAADAERLAMLMIADERMDQKHRSADGRLAVTPAAREAACRWAGRTQRWSMLAMAAETISPSALDQDSGGDVKVDPQGRTVATERLLAEALTQTGRVEQARSWWNYLVDARQADDFSTLLRCAEAETAVGRDTSLAQQRISAARSAAGEDRFALALVDLLDAELAIRRLRFDHARGLLENVVRSSQTDAALRGRAQWLIGETHYLQRSFSEAIEAYRLVEGIDPGGMWVSAALLQAGKSFEQLGRTREAAVCYGHLLSRFADTSHADPARRRMAAMAADHPSKDHSKRTIRR